MNQQIIKPAAAARLDRQIAARPAGVTYVRQVAAPRALFATPPADLLTLVIAEALKRRAQPEIQREALRDARFEMPVPPDRDDGHAPDIRPSAFDE